MCDLGGKDKKTLSNLTICSMTVKVVPLVSAPPASPKCDEKQLV